MKIAIQLVGTLRTLKDTIKFWNILFNTYEIDYFISISDLYDYCSGNYEFIDGWYFLQTPNKNILLDKIKLYNFVLKLDNKIKICEIVNFSNLKNTKPLNKLGYRKLIINNKRKEYEQKNNIKYDSVITSRTDMIFYVHNANIIKKTGSLNFHWYDEEHKPKNIDNVFFEIPNLIFKEIDKTREVFKRILNVISHNKKYIVVNDSTMGKQGFSIWEGFAISDSDTMDIYCNYDDKVNYGSNKNLWKDGKNYVGQLHIYLLKNNLDIQGQIRDYNIAMYYPRIRLTDEIIKLAK